LIIGLLTREHNVCSVSEAVLNKLAFCTKDFGYQTHNRENGKFAFTAASQILFLVVVAAAAPPPPPQLLYNVNFNSQILCTPRFPTRAPFFLLEFTVVPVVTS
jgi:hypothetical protein